MEDEPYYTIPWERPTAAFAKCWQAAGHGTRLRLGTAVAKLSRSLLRAPKDRSLVG